MLFSIVAPLFVFSLVTALHCVQCDDATDREVRDLYGEEAAADYGLATVAPPSDNNKRSTDVVWTIPITFNTRQIVTLNLRKTDGILADTYTPVWTASGRDYWDDDLTYISNTQMMSDIGDFAIYQDYANKAAVIYFYKDRSLSGFYRYYEFTVYPKRQATAKADSEFARRYYLIPSKATNAHGFGLPSVNKFTDRLRPSGIPAVVYPELLIVVDWSYIQWHGATVLRKILVYWNCVDMLFSGVKSPKIKINIAGIVIPTNEFATPWIRKADSLNTGIIANTTILLSELTSHFSKYNREFPHDNYDILVSYTTMPMYYANRRFVGVAWVDVACSNRKDLVTAINAVNGSYVAGAHELGHLFSAQHDQDTVQCQNLNGIMGVNDVRDDTQFFWSWCSLKYFENYFRHMRSACFDNCSKNSPLCSTHLPNSICARYANATCQQSGFELYGDFDCNYVACWDRKFGQVQKVPTLAGTICAFTSDQPYLPLRVCYRSQCLPYDADRGLCSL